jgi:parvulin-like peptidyl-prolyl isomerase
MTFLSRWTATISLTIVLTFGCVSLSLAVEDAIIAVVNDELITLRDLRDYAQSTYATLVTEGVSESHIQTIMSDLEKNGINKLIEDKLILSHANTIELEVREELVDERIDELKKRYGSEQILVEALVKTGANLTDLRNKILDEMKIKFIIEHQVKSKIYINPQEVTDYYEKNKDSFSRNARVNLESIYIAYTDDKSAASEKANNALAQIQEGTDFKEVSKAFSDAPSVGTVEKGQLLPLIEETIFNLEINEISSLVETENGIYIFKLIEKIPAEIQSLDAVKETIHGLLYKEKFKDRFISWLETLKADAYIEIK